MENRNLDFEDFAKENTNDLFHLILTVAISEFNILHSILVVWEGKVYSYKIR